ncbi:amidase [uncultured Tateyamaria sp.]|uniref:amidase n=1 Tax=uncultured Tateyamaria sp. TaxID=455651 RepID=UPI0026193C44|nr:amidase [uncultured Tateyamaria sp.]
MTGFDDPAHIRARLKGWDQHIHAFVTLADPVSASASGPLAGITVGVKDIIDVAGLPTRNGSATCEAATPARDDAPVVARLRAAGATIVGKTTTTEFAFTDPTQCRNPHDLARSPGGSSSGSGAAVGAGIVDIALGTQTAGSLCRPAAYCGAVGFKPSAGLLPREGVTPLAPSFDTVGIIGRNVGMVQFAFGAMAPPASARYPTKPTALCGLWHTGATLAQDWSQALLEAQDVFASIAGRVNSSHLPADVDAIVAAHRTVMGAEAAIAHGSALADARAPLLQPNFRAALEAGRKVTPDALAAARSMLAQAKQAFWAQMSSVNAVLTLPVPDGAPLLDGSTGFQDWLTPWTVVGGPLVCLPWGLDALSRPRSVMLAAHPGHDRWLLSLAAQLERHAPKLHAPRFPDRA